MIFNVSSGGGTALNFRVVGNPKPSTAKENTIWVDTDVPITSYIFSATQPTGVPGMVWIAIGTSSTVAFNALKKHGIQVYPISAKQYIGGAWVDKTAKSYQNGAWVDWWNGELFINGNEYEFITGGWVGTDYKPDGVRPVDTPVNDGTKLNFSYTPSVSYAGGGTAKKVDVTRFNTLRIVGESNFNSTDQRIGCYKSKNLSSSLVRETRFNIGKVDAIVDLSGLEGEYYIATVLYGYATKVVLEE